MKPKNNYNQHRRTEILREKNSVITLKSELEIHYNIAKISDAQNDLNSKLSQSTKYNTNLKADIKRKNRIFFSCFIFWVLFFWVLFFRVVLFCVAFSRVVPFCAVFFRFVFFCVVCFLCCIFCVVLKSFHSLRQILPISVIQISG